MEAHGNRSRDNSGPGLIFRVDDYEHIDRCNSVIVTKFLEHNSDGRVIGEAGVSASERRANEE